MSTENLAANSENWKSIDGYRNYQVSWWGRVSNTKTGRILKPGLSTMGYRFVILSTDGKTHIHYIHKLVAHEWVGNPEKKRCVDHRDGDRTNNHFENLRPATHAENNRNRSKRANASSIYYGVSWGKKQISGKLKSASTEPL